MDKETKKYAARVRVKTTWHPYIPPEIEPEPEAAPVPPCAKLLVRITEGSGFFSGDLGEEVDQLVPYFVGLIDDDPSFGSSSMTLRIWIFIDSLSSLGCSTASAPLEITIANRVN